MGNVICDKSISLDGYIAGPNASPENPLGDGGERLHQWVTKLKSWREVHGMEGGEEGPDSEVQREAVEATGAVVMGRRMFDEGEKPWGDDPPFHVPVFIVTHDGREPVVKEGGTSYTFVTDGIESALEQARAAAGDKDVAVAGANAMQQFLAAGLLDEIQLHVVPVFLGDGTRLFKEVGSEELTLEPIQVIDSPAVTHLRYRVVR